MKRRTAIILLLLAGGAIVNVAVAWGCAALAPIQYGQWTRATAESDELRFWLSLDRSSSLPAADWAPLPNPTNLGPEIVETMRGRGFGHDVFLLDGVRGFRDPPRSGTAFENAFFTFTPSKRSITFIRSGWPLPAFDSEMWATGQRAPSVFSIMVGGTTDSLPAIDREFHAIRFILTPNLGGPAYRVLPLRPVVPGFIINTLFYALLLWLLFFAPFAARRMLRRRRGLCEKCAYPIGTWGGSPVCTECGAAVSHYSSCLIREN